MSTNISQIIKSVAVLSSHSQSQSGIWVGPRLLISTLHLYEYIQGFPSHQECSFIKEKGILFGVESEISSQVLSSHSPKLRLIAFDIEHDIGLFKLVEEYPPNPVWADPKWIVERDEVPELGLKPGRKAACVGYNGHVTG